MILVEFGLCGDRFSHLYCRALLGRTAGGGRPHVILGGPRVIFDWPEAQRIHHGQWPRTHLRIMRITGRDDDMLIIRGVNVYPSQDEAALVGCPGLAPHYQIVLTRVGPLDAMTISLDRIGIRWSAIAPVIVVELSMT